MITDIQNFENAARIATADALLDMELPPRLPLLRWFGAAWLSLVGLLRG